MEKTYAISANGQKAVDAFPGSIVARETRKINGGMKNENLQ